MNRMIPRICLCVLLAAGTAAPSMAAESGDQEHLGRISKPDKVNAAVDKGLAYLVSMQDPVKGFFKGDKPNTLTGLSCMALMAAGHFPGRAKYGENLRAGILYLVLATEKDKGFLGNESNARMYGHGICTVALCESYGMMQNEPENMEVKKGIERALKVILNAQCRETNSPKFGGWRYEARPGDADLSVTAWQVLALRSAQNCKLDVPEGSIQDSLGYLRRTFHGVQKAFAYQPGGNVSPAMRSAGVVCMQALGANKTDADKSMVEDSASFLFKFDPGSGSHFYYQSYYAATAANMMGDKHLEALLPKMENALMALQMPNGEFRKHTDEQGEVYSTAFAVICLCVGYQYLPIYQE